MSTPTLSSVPVRARLRAKGRLSVLLIAESANPEWASVPLVGWSHSRALFDVTDAHLVTQIRNRDAIEGTGFREGEEFTVLDTEPVARPLWHATDAVRRVTGLGWTFDTAMAALPYYSFERQLWRRFGPDILAGKYDVVHRVTPLSPTIPSIIAPRCRRAGVPFVWGPINGGIAWPDGFADVQRREGEWLHYVRDAHRLLPGYRNTRRDASAIIVASRATLAQLDESAREKAVYIPENAIDEARFPRVERGPVQRPLRIVFLGTLVAYKGADMLLEAAAELLRRGEVTLDIIGDGPERGPLRALAAQLGVADHVTMTGWIPHREVATRMQKADVFGFPSVREFGGGAVVEAMALGLVPVVADYGGPQELVTDRTGFRVPFHSRGELIVGTRQVLEQLVAQPEQVRAIGERARERVLAQFTWKAKAGQTLEVYRWTRGERDKPNFGVPFGDPPPRSTVASATRAR